ncbi:hypothetical protein [Stutzerimonas degradans]|uniref:hypothetical protein n=1 Tax=Stutzerimonas degradans TaxID=2968968 RepID=UPI0012EAEA79|nr:hypothetical protein [Stutzerimonas degradans]NHW01905.1 hypothetical protein [Stutzerimonas degradans]QGW19455.1 hypothetical protein GOM96_00080 [Stutzerimonas degradans]
MTKKNKDTTETSFPNYYISSTVPVLAKGHRHIPSIFKSKPPKKYVNTAQSFYIDSIKYHGDERSSWYDAIEGGELKPSIDQNGNVRLLSNTYNNPQHAEWCKQIEIIASQWIVKYPCRNTNNSDQTSVDLILQALGQLSRYLPELQEKQANYFLDTNTHKIGVTLQGEGTLTLLIGGNSEVEYSYAQRQDSGLIRISGIAKLTKNTRNSKNIWKILNLQGIVG